jgi:hypothetical protein
VDLPEKSVAIAAAATATPAITATAATPAIAAAAAIAESTPAAPESAATASAFTAMPAAPAFLLAGFIYRQVAPCEFRAVQGAYGGLRFLLAPHFDEAETLGPPGFALGDDLRRHDRSVGSKRPLQIAVSYVVAQIADVEFLSHRHAPPR